MNKRTPAQGRGLLAGRVHQAGGFNEAGELRVTDRRVGVVVFVIHVREKVTCRLGCGGDAWNR